jgi:hypothetical protein
VLLHAAQAILAGAKEQSKAEAESVEGGGPVVTEQDIASIVAQWTGIPIEKVRPRPPPCPSIFSACLPSLRTPIVSHAQLFYSLGCCCLLLHC